MIYSRTIRISNEFSKFAVYQLDKSKRYTVELTKRSESVSHSVVSASLPPQGL